MGWLGTLLGKGIVEPVANYMQRRAELKHARFEAQLKAEVAAGDRRVRLISEGLAADASWETEFARQAASSWKDEYVLLVLSIPLVLCFVPGLAVYITAGFAALSATPSWYQWLVVMIYAATYGIRVWRRNITDT